MPSSDSEISVLFYRSADAATSDAAGERVVVTLALSNHSLGSGAAVATYRLDNHNASATAAWEAMGRPDYPSRAQLSALRKAAELAPFEITLLSATPVGSTLTLSHSLALPSLVLSHGCSARLAAQPPPPPKRLTLRPFNATSETDACVALSWRASAAQHACVRSYTVEHSPNGGSFVLANSNDFIFEAFTHAQPNVVAPNGCYRVAAVDYWGQRGSWVTTCLPTLGNMISPYAYSVVL